MKPEALKRGTELMQSIKKYEDTILALDPELRHKLSKSPVTRVEFRTDGGATVASLYSETELVERITAMVRREYQSRVLKFKNVFESL